MTQGLYKGDLSLETLIAKISAELFRISPEQLDRAIDDNLQAILEVLDLDRNTLWLTDPLEKALLHLTNYSTRPEIGPPALPVLDSSAFPWIVQKILRGEEVHFSRLGDLPEEAETDKATMRRFSPDWSSLAIPLMDGQRVFGAIVFGRSVEHKWSESVIQQLRLVAYVFGGALLRRDSDQNLKRAIEQLQKLKEQLESENLYLRHEVKNLYSHHRIIGKSAAIREVLEKIDQVAGTNSTVLLLGETGTGKELVASVIHESSNRKNRAMVRVNCGAIPAALVESEMFGREKGAYTGALTKQIGRFELADGSTIFLDEISDLPLDVQVKLLRVLEEREIERLGNPKPVKIDVRVIAATNQELQKALSEKRFRDDLFYRLNVFPIQIPALRERIEDIPLLVWSFVNDLSRAMSKTIETISRTTMRALQNYHWPGNIRELRNIIERAMILSNGPTLHIEMPSQSSSDDTDRLTNIEALHFQRILSQTHWRIRGKDGAADVLGIKPTTLESRLKKLGIARPKN